ncbi:MAG: prepilin-type N-terminal cleavage/methylation domain-containing protein [Candidatus Riflebacteria bacterium]|nr:prepilin-type N-terminal cleavage/methylation domain-containing protein [Candidatus Riflebacteria bacterium]
MKNQVLNKKGVTLIEILISVSVVAIISVVVMQFTSWMTNAQKITGWKQSAVDEQRLNEIFWQKHFTGATSRIESLVVDANGVITTPAVIATEPVMIRGGGSGNLMAAYPADGKEWPVWEFKTFEKEAASSKYIESTVTGFLKGSKPNIEFYGRVVQGGAVIGEQKLMSNVEEINSSSRFFPDENVTVLTVEFVVSYPFQDKLKVRKQSNFRISTVLETF